MTDAVSAVGFRSERGPVLIALMLTTGLVAIESTILSTAVPTVVADLGGFASFPWLFSIYLLAQAVTTPVYAKLADTIGRKPVVLFGIGLFLVGSIACGFAADMTQLILFRLLQGLGAGAVMPMAITILGDIYTVAERARVQGYMASVWAISSVVGPTLGGVFAEFVSWRWIFWVNIPLCLIAASVLWRRYDERLERTRHRIDVAGATLLTVGLTAVILATLEGGQAWAWNSPVSIGLYALGGLVLVAFAFVERRAAEPVLPPWLFQSRFLGAVLLVAIAIGTVIIGLTSYVPTYLEGTLSVTPLVGGLAVAALTLGWPISATLAGRVYLRIGFRATSLIGSVVATLGGVLLAALAPAPSVAGTAAACFLVGLGMGLVATATLVASQASVGWAQRGVVSGANMFARSIGSAVGIAVFGAVANGILAAGGGAGDPQTLTSASGAVFAGVAIVAVVMLGATALLPRDRPERAPQAEAEPA